MKEGMVRDKAGRGLPRPLTFLALAVGIAVIWLGAFGLARAYRFVEDDPRFCRSCHTMREAWSRWESGEHSGIGCHSCHKSDMLGSLRQVWQYVTKRPDEVHALPRVTAATCLGCHAQGEDALARADLRHAAGGRTDCLLCHGQELHRFQQPGWSAICESCH